MDQQRHPEEPTEAHREGVEQIEHARHHPTTEHDKAPREPVPPVIEPPGEKHRGGPLPNQKR